MLFVFDMDNVLFDYDWRIRMAGLTELTGLDLVELRRRWWHDEGEWAAEAGRWSDAEGYLAAFNTALGSTISPAAWLANRRAAMAPDADAIAAVVEASTHGTVSLLTNNNAMVEAHLPTLVPEIADVFGDRLFASAGYGARKPDPEVFRRMLARHGADAADTFFADDLPENVAGARSLGITGHVFTGAAGLRAAIDAFAAERGAAVRSA